MTPLYDITWKLYELMDKHAENNEQGERVYQGNVTKLYRQAGGSTRYYSLVRQLLLSPDLDPCIEIRQHGNRYQTTTVVLRHPPPDEWRAIVPADLTSPGVAARLTEVEQSVTALRAWRESMFKEVNILEVLRDFERRLTLLEGNGSVSHAKTTQVKHKPRKGGT